MPRLSPHAVRDILEMLEDGMNFLPKLPKIDKMRMRRRIRNQVSWLLEWSNPPAESILQRLEERLSEVFLLYPYGFRANLKKLVEEKTARLGSP